MKKITYIIAVITMVFNYTYSQQNLVPNPSFENYYSCPQGSGEIYKLQNWYNAGGSPDYFNVCGGSLLAPPSNLWGFQYPATGNAYAGIFGFANVLGYRNLRELISTQLTSTLSIGTKYYLSFKISAGFLSQASQVNIFTNNLGALLTKYKMDSSGVAPNKWHLINTIVSNDTTNWIRIKGSFTADSNYKYITIGNLKDSSSIVIDSTIAHQQGYTANSSYYYIDDVCLSTDSLLAYNYSPTFIKSNNNSQGIVGIYPNPVIDFLSINSELRFNSIRIVDYFGFTQKEIFFKQSSFSEKIDINNLQPGIYILEIKYENIGQQTQKLIIKK